MKQIWKYQLNPNSEIAIPQGGKVLSVQVQRDEPCIWVLVDPEAPKVTRSFVIYGTEHPIYDDRNLVFIGTFQLHGGGLVFHLFEKMN